MEWTRAVKEWFKYRGTHDVDQSRRWRSRGCVHSRAVSAWFRPSPILIARLLLVPVTTENPGFRDRDPEPGTRWMPAVAGGRHCHVSKFQSVPTPCICLARPACGSADVGRTNAAKSRQHNLADRDLGTTQRRGPGHEGHEGPPPRCRCIAGGAWPTLPGGEHSLNQPPRESGS